MGLAVDGAKTDDVPMIIYCLSRGQDPAGVRGNQVIEVSQHAIGEEESVHLTAGCGRLANNFTAIVDRMAEGIAKFASERSEVGHHAVA